MNKTNKVDPSVRAPRRNQVIAVWGMIALAFAIYLFLGHYVKAYSDPIGFLLRAESWSQGNPVLSRAPLYPMVLYVFLKLMGRDWVFLSNLPFLLLMLGAVAWFHLQVFKEDDSQRRQKVYAGLGALIAVTTLLIVRHALLLELLNPFREPLAFAFMVGGASFFICAWRSNMKLWVPLCSGLLLGLATSTRETCLLMVPPLMFWALVEMLCEKKLRFAIFVTFVVGLILGMGPLLKRNYDHSGNAVLPSYAAGKLEEVVDVKWDIPIPGMSLQYFGRTGPKIMKVTVQKYGYIGVGLFFLGLLWAMRKRNRLLLALALPSLLIVLLFYSFYHYYKARYLLGAELFMLPFIAAGGVCLVGLIKNERWQCLRERWIPILLTAWVVITLTASIEQAESRLKVWQIPKFREVFLEQIEQPACFFGSRHYAYMLAWIANATFQEFAIGFRDHFIEGQPFNHRLRSYSESVFKIMPDCHYYVYDHTIPLCENWLEFEPVFSFANLPVKPDHYGAPMNGVLYEMRNWNQTSTVFRLPQGADEGFLMLDMRRIWDVPGREVCHVGVVGSQQRQFLTNGVNFVEVHSSNSAGHVEFYIESNMPVPSSPSFKMLYQNDEFEIGFGMAMDIWAYNLLSDDFWQSRFTRTDAATLYDKGFMYLPNYAQTNRLVYADIRLEFLQEHPFWRSREHMIEARSHYHHEEQVLPPRARESLITVGLGEGTGELELVPVQLTTTVPSRDEQNSQTFRADTGVRFPAYVKVYDAHVYNVPQAYAFPLKIDLGERADGPYVERGFYLREGRPGNRTARWTSERAVLQVPLDHKDESLVMQWNCIPARPDNEQLHPTFTVSGHQVPNENIQIEHIDKQTTIYRYVVDPSWIEPDRWTEFEVEVPTWNPALVINIPDDRDLGVYVDFVQLDIADSQ